MANKKDKLDPATFLADLDRRPFQLKRRMGLEPVGLVLGQGENPLEVAIASAARKPSPPEAREVWEDLRDGRDVPLLLVVLYNNRAMTCGPVGAFGPATRIPVVLADRKPAPVDRLCRAALRLDDGSKAARFIWDQLPTVKMV